MKNFLVSSLPEFATYATIIVFFTYNVLFDREEACTCKDQKVHCDIYISVPIFIIFLLLLWNDKSFNGTCRAYCCMRTRRISGTKCCHIIFLQIVKALVIGLLWVISVLFDGDWYACCRNGLSKEEAQIPCKTNRTPEEQATIDNLKNESKIIGLYVLLVLLFLVVCYSLLKWWDYCYSLQKCCDCCMKKCCDCCRKWSGYIDGDGLYELIAIKEEENIVNDILKERAKETLKKKVNEILVENKTKEYMDDYELHQKVINQLRPEGNQENIEGTSGDGEEEMPLMSTSSIQHDEGF
ncbi:uncharacterized protein LOC122826413 [Gambusia affinis]|uniref:uncharacterized protein LOC122826413 n=1 Tax=Gambusia affinis TaxID=33528 RepID=UPI001CDD5362|nr:uncharacterized protein LOC122826413 [Gambusia affinis]XP_043964173.1 uncharacterized protein LOC122826413 [Gambusia affinis]XP_043964174.1 uncharacterized protein LOC122826413 [Gambusia affinis]